MVHFISIMTVICETMKSFLKNREFSNDGAVTILIFMTKAWCVAALHRTLVGSQRGVI